MNTSDRLIRTHKGSPNSLVKRSLLNIPPGSQEFSITDLKDYLENEHHLIYGKDYTEGNLANSIYYLTSRGFLIKTGRGIYRRAADSETADIPPTVNTPDNQEQTIEASEKMEKIQRNCESEINNITKSVNNIFSTLAEVPFIEVRTVSQRETMDRLIAYCNALREITNHYEAEKKETEIPHSIIKNTP